MLTESQQSPPELPAGAATAADRNADAKFRRTTLPIFGEATALTGALG